MRLNWNRTQYLFALNAAVLAAGATLASAEEEQQPQTLVAAIFLVGILAALQAIAITWRQHQYYRSARDHMQRVERPLARARRVTTGSAVERFMPNASATSSGLERCSI